jgi:peptide/nickel transport system ATP-binding protein
MARRVLVMDAGRIVEEGPPAEVLATPRSDAARQLVANFLSVDS